jgi:hypothetical protein
LQEALLSIKFAMRRKFGKLPTRTKLIFPSVSRRDHPDRFRNLFDEGHIAPAGFLSPAVEVLYIPQVGTLMLVSVALSGSVEVSIGFASIAAEPLARVVRKLTNVDARLEELWNRREVEDEEPLPLEPEVDDAEDI